jgi:hypothetical protein
MKRRHFLGAASASVLFPGNLQLRNAALASVLPAWDYVFFDERFERAQLVAASWSALNQPIAVHGDITPFWMSELHRMPHHRPLHIRGVTTASIHFCLKVLLGERTNLHEQVLRLDRNLLLWTMRTSVKSDYGMTP